MYYNVQAIVTNIITDIIIIIFIIFIIIIVIQRVQLKFMSFDLENSPSCSADVLMVLEDDVELARYCGGWDPGMITSTDDTLQIMFRSDSSIEMGGFSIRYDVTEQHPVGGLPSSNSAFSIT